MRVNKVFKQRIAVYCLMQTHNRRRQQLDVTKITHWLQVESSHTDKPLTQFASVDVRIPKGTYRALVQDHGAEIVTPKAVPEGYLISSYTHAVAQLTD